MNPFLEVLYVGGVAVAAVVAGGCIGAGAAAMVARVRRKRQMPKFARAFRAQPGLAVEAVFDRDRIPEAEKCPDCGEVHGMPAALEFHAQLAYDTENGCFVIPVRDVTDALRSCVNVPWGRYVASALAEALDTCVINLSADMVGQIGLPEDKETE